MSFRRCRPGPWTPGVWCTSALWVALVLLVGLGAAPASADQTDPRLEGLFTSLRESVEPEAASRIADRIWRIWNTAGDEETDELMRIGSQSLERGNLDHAIDVFSRIIQRSPEFAEGWNKRATAYYQMGDYEASIRDVAVVLRLEPRHFAALSGMGLIYSELGADSPALRWFERALEVYPHLRGVPEQAEAIRLKLHEGDI